VVTALINHLNMPAVLVTKPSSMQNPKLTVTIASTHRILEECPTDLTDQDGIPAKLHLSQ